MQLAHLEIPLRDVSGSRDALRSRHNLSIRPPSLSPLSDESQLAHLEIRSEQDENGRMRPFEAKGRGRESDAASRHHTEREMRHSANTTRHRAGSARTNEEAKALAEQDDVLFGKDV
jgi:hypothetical protein